jgi:hypothetical protein
VVSAVVLAEYGEVAWISSLMSGVEEELAGVDDLAAGVRVVGERHVRVHPHVDVDGAGDVVPGPDGDEARLAVLVGELTAAQEGAVVLLLWPLPPTNPEYSPSASQCQISTRASASGAQSLAWSTTVKVYWTSKPSLSSRMSSRTRAPSREYGPSVTSAVRVQTVLAGRRRCGESEAGGRGHRTTHGDDLTTVHGAGKPVFRFALRLRRNFLCHGHGNVGATPVTRMVRGCHFNKHPDQTVDRIAHTRRVRLLNPLTCP